MSSAQVEDGPDRRGFSRRAIEEIREIRRRSIAAGTWPEHSTTWWAHEAEEAHRRRREHLPPERWDREALSLFPAAKARAA